MAVKIQFRRDTAAEWAAANPVLDEGEIGLDLTNNQFKIGNGTDAWNSLKFWTEAQMLKKVEVVAGSGQTVFTAPHAGVVDVMRNGFSLATSDFTLGEDGLTVTLAVPCAQDDIVVVRSWQTFSIADAVPLTGGDMIGPLGVPKLTVTGSSHIQLPRGATAQRPQFPVGGMLRYNTDSLAIEAYNGDSWYNLTPSSSTPAVQSFPSRYSEIDADIRKLWTDPTSLASKLAMRPMDLDYRYNFYYWFMQDLNRILIDPDVHEPIFLNIFNSEDSLSCLMEYQEGWDFITSQWKRSVLHRTKLEAILNRQFFIDHEFDVRYVNAPSASVNYLTTASALSTPYLPAGTYDAGDILSLSSISVSAANVSYSSNFKYSHGVGPFTKYEGIEISVSYSTPYPVTEFGKDYCLMGSDPGCTMSYINNSSSYATNVVASWTCIKRPTKSVAASYNPYL